MPDRQAKIVLAAEERTGVRWLASNLGTVKTQAEQLNSSFLGLNTGLVGAFSAVGITSFLGKVVNGIDNLNDLADATGSSIGNGLFEAVVSRWLRVGSATDWSACE